MLFKLCQTYLRISVVKEWKISSIYARITVWLRKSIKKQLNIRRRVKNELRYNWDSSLTGLNIRIVKWKQIVFVILPYFSSHHKKHPNEYNTPILWQLITLVNKISHPFCTYQLCTRKKKDLHFTLSILTSESHISMLRICAFHFLVNNK